jgi:dienelactone hydrolase
MENVIFESLPGFYITANLYRPNEAGRYPAVLMSAGHTTTGKTENHRMAAQLAAKGFVALAPDPIGLGERIQALDPRTRRHAGGCCANEHLQGGAQAMLIGSSIARYFIWDAKRSIDYLASRTEVDPDRIGAAGCSGGGCVTTYIAALDSRVKAAAPACFINSFRALFTGPTPDSEMSLPGLLAAGLDHADFLEMAAPLPWLIQATEGDFFTPAAARLVYEEARRWYRLYNAEDRVAFFVAPGPHGTPRETREAMYGWMIRWLKDGKGDPVERDIPLYEDRELVVTTSGQVQEEPGSRKLHEVIRAEFTAMRTLRPPTALQAYLRGLGITTPRKRPAVRSLENGQIAIAAESGIEIRARLHLRTGHGRKPALLLVRHGSDRAPASLPADEIVLEIEPRDSPASNDRRPYLGNWLVNERADIIGRCLPALRARDILLGVDLLASRDDVDHNTIHAAATGVSGVWLLLAAASDTRITSIQLDRTPATLASAMDTPLNTNLFDGLIRGFLLHWDLPDLASAMGNRKVNWSEPQSFNVTSQSPR